MPESSPLRAAAIQLHAGENKPANLARAERLVEQAARDGARLVVLPEYFNCLGHLEEMVRQAEPIPGPTSEWLAALARRLGILLVGGTLCESGAPDGRGYNTCLVFSPEGRELAHYSKMHLFDAEAPGRVTFHESRWIAPGPGPATFDVGPTTAGLAVCYDLRFPELYRALVDRGMEVLAFPSAFAQATGVAHWEVLLRARAIENQIYVVAANQYGLHTPNFTTYGHACLIDPWGTVLAEAPSEGDAVVIADLDLARLREIREQLPCLKHRRL